MNDGSICNDTNIVMNTWKDSFCNMLNQNYSNLSNNFDNSIRNDDFLDRIITSDEVYKILMASKN